MNAKCLLAAASIALWFAGVGQASVIFQLNPASGVVYGAANQTVGWGFTLTNSDADFLLVTGTSFVPLPLSSFGTYTDLLSGQSGTGGCFLVLGPSGTCGETPSLTELFNPVTMTGAGEFTLAGTASGGIVGNIVVHYSLFSVSPNSPTFDPSLDTLVADASVSAPAAINPEPGTLLLVGGAGIVLGLLRRRRSKA